jgi:Ca2+-binding EF-hand superfamily protein
MAGEKVGGTSKLPPQFRKFDKVDKNQDGVLTGNEINKKYEAFDANKDGKIDKAEYEAGTKAELEKWTAAKKEEAAKKAEQRIEAHFNKADKNKDGILSGTEIKKKKFDIDSDGKVGLPEFKEGHAKVNQERREARAEKRFDKLDTNKDGKLTGTEITDSIKSRDGDSDGTITKEEFLAPVKAKAPQTGSPTGGGPGTGTSSSTTTDSTSSTTDSTAPATKGDFKTFKQRDANKDGILSGNELKGLTGYDLDGNKEVTEEEFLKSRNLERKEVHENRREKAFGKLDGNKDGVLTGTEYKKVEQYDADKDGKVTIDEFHAGKKADWKAKIEKKSDNLFGEADVNKDGVLTGTETKKFAAYDADKDGSISKDEFKAGEDEARKKKREEAILGG